MFPKACEKTHKQQKKKENVKKPNRLQLDGFNKGKQQKLCKQTMWVGVWNRQGLRKKVGEWIQK